MNAFRLLKDWLFPLSLATGLVVFQCMMTVIATSSQTPTMHDVLQGAGRIVATIFLAFMIYAAAQSVTASEDEARLGALLATGGMGLGWLHGVIVSVLDFWHTGGPAPDLTSAFAIVPTVLADAQTILSVALLLCVMRGSWEVIHDRSAAPWFVGMAIVALGLIRPELLPLAAMAVGMAWMKKLGRRPAQTRIHFPALTLAECTIVAFIGALLVYGMDGLGYLPLHAVPTAHWDRWLFTLLPVLAACTWVALRHDRFVSFYARSRWCLGWILASFILLFFPVPWHTVFLTGLMVPLVLLSLPAWSAVLAKMAVWARVSVLSLLVGVTPVFLLVSEAMR